MSLIKKVVFSILLNETELISWVVDNYKGNKPNVEKFVEDVEDMLEFEYEVGWVPTDSVEVECSKGKMKLKDWYERNYNII